MSPVRFSSPNTGFCCVGGGRVGGVGLMNGVTGDGVSTVPLFFKLTVVLVQVVGSARVIERVEGLRFVVCDLFEPFPDRCWVVIV